MAGGTGAFQTGTQLPGFLNDLLALNQAHTNIAVASIAVAYSKSFVLRRGVTFGWAVKFSSSGVCTVTVELEQSDQPPTTEGSQDDAFVIPQGKGTTNGLFPAGVIVAAATWYRVAYAPIATVLGRLKITGTGSNDASTILTGATLYEIKNQ
jgi:hypothetical protein